MEIDTTLVFEMNFNVVCWRCYGANLSMMICQCAHNRIVEIIWLLFPLKSQLSHPIQMRNSYKTVGRKIYIQTWTNLYDHKIRTAIEAQNCAATIDFSYYANRVHKCVNNVQNLFTIDRFWIQTILTIIYSFIYFQKRNLNRKTINRGSTLHDEALYNNVLKKNNRRIGKKFIGNKIFRAQNELFLIQIIGCNT